MRRFHSGGGTPGPPGPPGPPGLVWRGTWDALTPYSVGDVVFSVGTSYVCTSTNTGHLPPASAFWDSLAERGATWFEGSGVPFAVLGSKFGDYYLDVDTGDIYILT